MRHLWIVSILLTAAVTGAMATIGWDYTQRLRNESRITATEKQAEADAALVRRLDERLNRIEQKIDRVQERLIEHMAQK